jgi:hypothetical protein
MCQRTQDGEREPEGSAQARLDNDLDVSRWLLPGQAAPKPVETDPGAPWWWHGDEDASQAFLAAQGVSL